VRNEAGKSNREAGNVIADLLGAQQKSLLKHRPSKWANDPPVFFLCIAVTG